MNVSDLLNPLPKNKFVRTRCISTPVIPSSSSANTRHYYEHNQHMDLHQLHQQHLQHQNLIGKPRSRFSEYEDNIIRQGVAQRLTWGQISDLLPHRKRATCFNRYRTLQGIRKSRKLSEANSPEMSSSASFSPTSPVTSCFSDPKTPSPPPSTSSYTNQPHWFTPSDVIYEHNHHQQHLSLAKYPASYSSSSSDSSSDDNDDFPFAAQTTMTKRSHKVSLPALNSYHPHHHHHHHYPPHHRSTSTSTTTCSATRPYYNL